MSKSCWNCTYCHRKEQKPLRSGEAPSPTLEQQLGPAPARWEPATPGGSRKAGSSAPFPALAFPSALYPPPSPSREPAGRCPPPLGALRGASCSACATPPRPTRGFAFQLPPGLRSTAPGPRSPGPAGAQRRKHHGRYRDVTRGRPRGARAVETVGGGAGVPLGALFLWTGIGP